MASLRILNQTSKTGWAQPLLKPPWFCTGPVLIIAYIFIYHHSRLFITIPDAILISLFMHNCNFIKRSIRGNAQWRDRLSSGQPRSLDSRLLTLANPSETLRHSQLQTILNQFQEIPDYGAVRIIRTGAEDVRHMEKGYRNSSIPQEKEGSSLLDIFARIDPLRIVRRSFKSTPLDEKLSPLIVLLRSSPLVDGTPVEEALEHSIVKIQARRNGFAPEAGLLLGSLST